MNYSRQETERIMDRLKQADQLINRMEEHLKKDPDFSASDMATLHDMAQAWRGWVAMGRVGKWIITLLGLLAAAVASWGVLASTVKGWFN